MAMQNFFQMSERPKLKKIRCIFNQYTSVIYKIINILAMKANGSHGLARKLGN